MMLYEPPRRLRHRLGVEGARYSAPGFLSGDEAGVNKHVEVLHNGLQRNRKWARQLAHGEVTAYKL